MNVSVEEIKDFIKKEYELKNHHAFLFAYPKGITVIIDPHLICKATNKIEDDESLNDTMQYWVEVVDPTIIDVPSNVKYLSDIWTDLPHNAYINKGLTGCGRFSTWTSIRHRFICNTDPYSWAYSWENTSLPRM